MPEQPTQAPTTDASQPPLDWNQVFESEQFRKAPRASQYAFIAQRNPKFAQADQSVRDAWFNANVLPRMMGKAKPKGYLSSAAAGILEALPIEAVKTIWNDPRWPITIGRAMYEAQKNEYMKGKAASERQWQDYVAGRYGPMVNEFIDAFSHDLAAVVPGVGPGMMYAMEEIEQGRKSKNQDQVTRGMWNAATQLAMFMLPVKRTPGAGGAIAHAPEVEAIGVTPTLTETMSGHVGQAAKSIDPRLARLAIAEKVAEPFMVRREAEVARAAEVPATAITQAPLAEAPSRLVQRAAPQVTGELAAGRLATAEAAIPTPIIYEEGENIAYDAIRGNERAARQIENSAWNALKSDIRQQGLTVPVEPLRESVTGFAQLQKGARDLIIESVPPSVYAVLNRAANRMAPELSGSILQQLPQANVEAWLAEHPEIAQELGIAAEDRVPFDVVHEARSGIGGAIEHVKQAKARGLPGADRSLRYLSRAYATLTTMMRDTLSAADAGQPGLFGPGHGLLERFDTANAITKARRGAFIKPDLVRAIVTGERDQLEGLYRDIMKGGGKARPRLAVVNALRPSATALRNFRDGLTEYVMRQARKESATGQASLDYNAALRAIDEKRVPGIKEIFGPERYERLRSTLKQLQANANNPETLRYQKFLQGITSAQDSRAAIRQIWKVPDRTERAIQMSANDPQLATQIAAGLYAEALDDATSVRETGRVVSSGRLSQNLKSVTPVIERILGPERATGFVRESKKLQKGLDRLSLPTKGPTKEGLSGYISLGSGYQIYYFIHALSAIGTGRWLTAANQAFMFAVPALYTALNVAPGSMKMVRDIASFTVPAVGIEARVGLALPRDRALKGGTPPYQPPTPPPEAPKLKTHRATKGSESYEGEISDEDAEALRKAGYEVQ